MKVAMITDIPRLYERTMYLSALEQEARRVGIETNGFIVESTKLSLLDAKLPVFRLIRGLFLLNEMRRYDILHVQFTLPFGFLLTLTGKIHGKPVLIHTHGYDVFTLPEMNIGLRRIKIADCLSKTSWKATSHIIAVCEKAKQAIISDGIASEKVSVLYNGVNEAFFRRGNIERQELVSIREGNDLVLLNVGNLVPVKNHKMLLTAFADLLRRNETGSRIALIICGEGPLKFGLQKLTYRLGVEDQVVFLGQVPHLEMPELYTLADAFVLPSLSEAHPWSILEAMSCELPVSASRVGGIPETVDDEELLFNPLNKDEIRLSLERLVESPKKRRNLGLHNRKIVLEKFTLRKHVENLASIYSNTLAS